MGVFGGRMPKAFNNDWFGSLFRLALIVLSRILWRAFHVCLSSFDVLGRCAWSKAIMDRHQIDPRSTPNRQDRSQIKSRPTSYQFWTDRSLTPDRILFLWRSNTVVAFYVQLDISIFITFGVLRCFAWASVSDFGVNKSSRTRLRFLFIELIQVQGTATEKHLQAIHARGSRLPEYSFTVPELISLFFFFDGFVSTQGINRITDGSRIKK